MARALRSRSIPVLAIVGAGAACAGAGPAPVSSAPSALPAAREAGDGGAAKAPPSLVVALVVDQLAAWVAEERLPLLPPDGGFARLRREGTWVKEMAYGHSVTDTAPGHSALFTGAVPRATGIFANETMRESDRSRLSIVRDETTHLVTARGATDTVGASLAVLRVPTVADALREARPDARVVALSLKDRGALFAAGRKPRAALWFDPGLDAFVTSTAFASALPAWAMARATPAALAQARAKPWTVLDGPWLASHVLVPDDGPGEGNMPGYGVVFPHDVSRAKDPPRAFRTSPFGDEVLLDLALDAVDGESAGAGPMLLSVSLSANDYVGHVFGPDSWEAWDELRRLDGALARFFAGLDARVGKDGWAAILSGDHGTVSTPEAARLPALRPWCKNGAAEDRWQRPCGPVGRLDPDTLGEELDAAAQRTLGPGPVGHWVTGVADPYVFFTARALALPPARRAELEARLTKTLLAHAEVEAVRSPSAFPGPCPPLADSSVPALLCRAVTPDARAAALYIQLRAGSSFDPLYARGRGTSHGSPYRFDRTVPLLVRAPGRTRAGRTVEDPAPFTAYARTLSSLLGAPPPAAAAEGPNLAAPF